MYGHVRSLCFLVLTGHNPPFQSGDGPDIMLVDVNKPPVELRDRWKVVEKMSMIPQYAFAGDYTGEIGENLARIYNLMFRWFAVEAIEKSVNEVAKFDAGSFYLDVSALEVLKIGPIQMIGSSLPSPCVSFFNLPRPSEIINPSCINAQDANFGRYQITPDIVSAAMKRNPKVHTALVCIGEGAEASWCVPISPEFCPSQLVNSLCIGLQNPSQGVGSALRTQRISQPF